MAERLFNVIFRGRNWTSKNNFISLESAFSPPSSIFIKKQHMAPCLTNFCIKNILQGVVGESVFVSVPLVNNFNTSLLLTKSFLLWRFTDEEDGQTYSNDKRSGSEEVGGGVQDLMRMFYVCNMPYLKQI